MPQAHTRTTEHIAYAQRERLAFIEVRSYFCGAVTRAQIEERFGVKPAASARDLIAYRELAPGNLRYNAALRCYQPTPDFAPAFSHSPAHVLSWLRSGTGDGLEVGAAQAVPCETAHDLVQPNLGTLATITRAITSGTVLEVNYLSLTSGASVKRLAPLALADTGYRWHLRAYDQRKNRFADFVLTRIESARPTQDPIPDAQKLADDSQWNHIVPLELVPHPGLPFPAAIELDYGMSKGQLLMTVRAPLVGYALKRWSVDCTPGHTLSFSSHHLWLRNGDVLHGVESAVIAPGFTPAPPPAPMAKPIQVVRVSDMGSKTYLESEADVEGFVAQLIAELLATVRSGKKARVQ